MSYDAVASSGAHTDIAWPRTGDDLWLIYTGGTTGAPKGVMWRQDDLLRVLNGRAAVPVPVDAGLDAHAAQLTHAGPVAMIASPLMHAAAQVRAFPTLNSGGSVVTLTGRRFDPVEVLDTIVRRRANSLAIVGDAFARPLVEALDAEPDRWDISSLQTISSSGALFSETVVRALLRHNPTMSVIDVVGASEAMGVAFATWTVDSTFAPGQFVPSPDTACSTTAGWRGAATSRSATTRTPSDRRPRSRSSTASAGRCRATTPPSSPTARCACSAAARAASTPRERRCGPKRSRA